MMRPSANNLPVSCVTGRTKLTFNSSVVYPCPAASLVAIAQPIAESSTVESTPPCVPAMGLACSSPGVNSKTTRPSSSDPKVKPTRRVIGGAGSVPAFIASRYSMPESLRPAREPIVGSFHSTTRCRKGSFVPTRSPAVVRRVAFLHGHEHAAAGGGDLAAGFELGFDDGAVRARLDDFRA